MSYDSEIHLWLERFVAKYGGVAGTVHQRTIADDLELVAVLNIPPVVQDLIQRVPRGKGMAGLAFDQNEPISTCNIKDDNTGRVRPGAKAVDARAAITLPVRDKQGNVRAVVGIAFAQEREIMASDLAALEESAAMLPTGAD